MDYRVRISEHALADLDAIVAEMTQRGGTATADAWLTGMTRAMARLATSPHDHPLAPESAETGFEARQMPYLNHRVLFEIAEGAVNVLRTFPGAGQNLTLNLLRTAA